MHLTNITVVGDEGMDVVANSVLIKQRPVFQIFARCAISLAAAFIPKRPVVWNLSRSSMQNETQPFFLPTLPLIGRPQFTLQCVRNDPFGLWTIPQSL
jgi:hypothetical protein